MREWIARHCNRNTQPSIKGCMSSLARVKYPKIILGVVGTVIAVPVLGITISLVGVSANTQQEVSVQEKAQDEVSVQHDTVPTVAPAPAVVVVESMPAQAPLPDPHPPRLDNLSLTFIPLSSQGKTEYRRRLPPPQRRKSHVHITKAHNSGGHRQRSDP